MLKRVPLQTISELHKRTGIKQTEPASFTRFPYFEYFEKHNPRDIILMNSTLQVLVAMTYHNDYYSGCHVPFQFEFTSPMPLMKFVSLPTIQLFPSLFNELRVFTRDNLISGIWAKELAEGTIKAHEALRQEGKIDDCLATLFRTNTLPNPLNGDNLQNAKAYEFVSNNEQESLDAVEPYVFRNKFFMYLLSELSRNGNTIGASPLQGWSKDELESCKYFYDLKKICKRVFVYGWGEQWQSTGLLVSEPLDLLNSILNPAFFHAHVIGKGYSI